MRNLLIQSGAVKPPSGINSWAGWPEHVVDTLRRWNSNGRLSFRYLDEKYPECKTCGLRFTRQATVAVLYRVAERNGMSKYGHTTCDDCLIKRAEESQ